MSQPALPASDIIPNALKKRASVRSMSVTTRLYVGEHLLLFLLMPEQWGNSLANGFGCRQASPVRCFAEPMRVAVEHERTQGEKVSDVHDFGTRCRSAGRQVSSYRRSSD
jgi:hypothetical protein